MTGLECLREEMKKRGMNKAQCDSKVAAVVLDILANTGNVYSDTWKAEQELAEVRAEYTKVWNELQALKYAHEYSVQQHNAWEREALKKKEELIGYIEAFHNSLADCETEEGADKLRAAQMFVNSVEVKTAYDNTAFIIGLSAILSGGGVGALEELKKINPSLFGEHPIEKSRKYCI